MWPKHVLFLVKAMVVKYNRTNEEVCIFTKYSPWFNKSATSLVQREATWL